MPADTTVWAVELWLGASAKERKGSLALEPGALRFTPAHQGEPGIAIALLEMTKVRRVRGSPVLMVTHASDHGPLQTAFYFAQPPPLGPVRGDISERPALGGLRSGKRTARRANVSYLGTWNQQMKELLREWERAVAGAARTAREA